MLRCLGDTLAWFSAKVWERHVKMPGRHLGIFLGKMPERHVKISYADTSALFSERHVKMSGRHFSRKILRDTFRCLGDILAFFSGKMSVRNVKILPCLWGILLFVQAKCLRDMLRCQGDRPRLLGYIFFQVRCLERHRASNFQQFPGETA